MGLVQPLSFQKLFDLESELSNYTGAPYVVVTDGCTHALELCFRYYQINQTKFTAYTYVSVVQLMLQLGIQYSLLDEKWSGEYQFHGTNIWDSARRLQPQMYKRGQVQCLSFGHTKPLEVGRCGAILLDDVLGYHKLSQMRSDGRDLRVVPWHSQSPLSVGWHYCPSLETIELTLTRLRTVKPQCQTVTYPDCRKISIRV